MLTEKFPNLKGLILDMDGVLWHDTQAIGNLPALIRSISDLGLRYVFATNNATKTIGEYQEKLLGFGLEVSPEQIITSAGTTALYCKTVTLRAPASTWLVPTPSSRSSSSKDLRSPPLKISRALKLLS